MGIIYKPQIPMCWSVDKLIATPIFSETMPHNRFYLILKFLHFNYNLDPEFDVQDKNHDKLHKAHPLIEILRSRCRHVYSPGSNISVDESFVLFKGCLKFRQYIKTKCARFGIKL